MTSNVVQGSTRLILIGAALLLSVGMGLRQSLGLFLTPLTRDLGLTAADFTLTIAIQNIVWGMSQAPVGAIADRFGLRITLVAGTAIYIAGLAVMAAAGGETALVVSGVLIGIALSCTASSLALAACARAVPEQSRSKTLGVVAAIGSLGSLIVPLATQGVLAYFPWQIGALFFAILAAATLPAAFWAGASDKLPVMMAKAKTTMRDTLAQALRHRGFLVMSGAYFVCGLNLVFLTTHLPAYLAICGQDPMLSAAALARRCQRRWCLAGGLARRSLSEARLVGPALHPAGDCVRRLLLGVADGDHNADLFRGNGPAVVPWGVAASQRLGRRDVRHSLYGDAARDLIRHAPGRGLAGGMGRWAHLRCDRLLRRRLEDWCTGRVCGRHRTDLRRRSRAPP